MKMLFIILTVMQSFLASLEQNTLVSDFTLSVTESQSTSAPIQPMTYTGSIAMRGKQFSLNMFAMEAAYDGHTLYIYSEDVEELTLSIPSEEELMLTNPFFYAQALLPICEYEEKGVGDKVQMTLTPHDQSAGIVKFVLRVMATTQLPVAVEIHEENGKMTTLRLSNVKYVDQIPSFVLEKEGVFVNDLR